MFAWILLFVGAPINATEMNNENTNTGENVQVAEVTGLQVMYDEEKERITLSYVMSQAEYVKIYVNNAVDDENYTGSVYYFENVEEGKDYIFKVEPYNAKGERGTAEEVSISIGYKKARIDELDVDYDLEEKILLIDWEGKGIAKVDILQDSLQIATQMAGDRYLATTELLPLTKYKFTVIPYNTIGEVGEQKTVELLVDDYIARVDDLDVVYDETKQHIQLSWSGTYTNYIEVYLNDELLVGNYKEKTYTYPCKLQPGATYILSVIPFNDKKEDGDVCEEEITFGDFDIPEVYKAKLTYEEVLDSANKQTAFCRPAVNITWEAQKRAIYEVYRAPKDKKAAYVWIATVTADVTGKFTYTDATVGIGKYYYKIRRKIKEDAFHSQDVYSALSDSVGVNASLPKPKVTAVLDENAEVYLEIGTTKEYVSGYEIHRKEGTKNFKRIAVISGNTYSDTDISFDKSYTYKVRSYFYNTKTGKKSYGKYSSNIKVKTTVGQLEAKAIQISENELKLEWNAVANAQGYEIYHKSNTMGDAYTLLTTITDLTYVKKLNPTANYNFMIKAYRENAYGVTYFSSAEISGKMGLSAPKGLMAKKVSYKWNKTAQTLTEKVTLSWDRVYGAEGYYIQYYDTVKKKYRRLDDVANGKKTTYVISNLVTKGQQPIRYRIKAYDENKEKAGETIDILPNLGKVKKVALKKEKDNITISWKKVTGAEGYQVYRSNGRHAILIGETAGTTISDSGLTPGVEYRYYVEAYNKTLGLTGNRSDEVVYIAEIGKVGGFTAKNMEDGTVALTWKAKKDAKAYRIYFSTEKYGEYQLLEETTQLTYVHKKVAALTPGNTNATVYYRVVAVQVNSAGIDVESLPNTKMVEFTIGKVPETIKGKL